MQIMDQPLFVNRRTLVKEEVRMNQLPQSQEQIQANVILAQWVQFIVPVITGITGAVYAAGMIRDLVKGKEVKLPSQRVTIIKGEKIWH